MYHQFTRIDAENILRSSENKPTSYRGTGKLAHAGSLHLLLSNAELLERYEEMSEKEVWRNGRRRRREYTLITAFCALPDMIDAAERVLNSRQSQAALADFFLNTPQGPGMRAEICYTSDIDYTMRYAQGWTAVRTMPVRDLVMVLDRVDGRPFRLQIQTFFGTLQDISRNSSTIFMPDGKPYRSHSVPAWSGPPSGP